MTLPPIACSGCCGTGFDMQGRICPCGSLQRRVSFPAIPTVQMKPSNQLRELRMWHWKKAVTFRAAQTKKEKLAAEGDYVLLHTHQAKVAKRSADFHLKAVQTLNDCFPFGDTAERDCAKKGQ